MGKTFNEWFEETKQDHLSDISGWIVTETIFGNEICEDRLRDYLLSVWEASRQNMTYKDI